MITLDPQVSLPVPPQILVHAAELALATSAEHSEADLTIVIGDDALLLRYNLQYLGIDAPTDVLSFPADFIQPESGQRYLGDILISLPRAQDQASAGGHDIREELELLVVHGVLHLLGHDHADQPEKERMQIVQDAVMAALGSTISVRL
jgi:probable rRNA maturation factor